MISQGTSVLPVPFLFLRQAVVHKGLCFEAAGPFPRFGSVMFEPTFSLAPSAV